MTLIPFIFLNEIIIRVYLYIYIYKKIYMKTGRQCCYPCFPLFPSLTLPAANLFPLPGLDEKKVHTIYEEEKIV